jgi:nickel-dependent lactate racemase
VRVELAYGRGALAVELPEEACSELRILEKTEGAPLPDPARALRSALEAPIGTRPLRELARGRRDAVIVVSDRTRPVPNALLLPPILDALREGGLPAERVTVQVATGLHRPCTAAELEEMLGAPLAGSLRIVQHDARDLESHVDLGSRSGLPVLIDRFFLERDLRIATGLIEPHLMAGYSGGRKAVCPGLAAVETIRVAHGASMLEGHVGPGIVAGNPLHEALLEVVRKIGVDFLVNVALDRRRRVAGVFCGDLEAAHAEGMRFVEAESHVALDRPADLVIVSAGGHPLDTTFYQAIKGVAAAAGVVRSGGIILLAASLSEGIGSPSFEKCLRESEGPAAFELCLRDDRFFAIDQWMVQHLCQALRRARVFLYSDGLDRATQRELFVEPVASPEEGVARALTLLGPKPRTVVIPQGPYILATIRGEKRPIGGPAGP